MNSPKMIQVLRHSAYVFTIGLSAYSLFYKYNGNDASRFFIYLALICIAQLFLKIKALDLILGFILTVLWGFMTLGFVYDEIDDVHWAPWKEPGFYFLIATFLSSLGVIAHSLIAYSEKNSPAIVQPD